PQHAPRVTMWYETRFCAPDGTADASVAPSGNSITHGADTFTRKNSAPVSRTACSTSERRPVSVGPLTQTVEECASESDLRSWSACTALAYPTAESWSAALAN